MKKIILLVLMISGCSSQTVRYMKYGKKNPLNIDTAIKNSLFTNDTFEGVFKVEPKNRESGERAIFSPHQVILKPFIAIINRKKVGHFLNIKLFGDGWMFMNAISIKCSDKKLEISFKPTEILREIVLSPRVIESYNHKLSQKEFNFFKTCKVGDLYRLRSKNGYIEGKVLPEEYQYFQENQLIASYLEKISTTKFIKRYENKAKKK